MSKLVVHQPVEITGNLVVHHPPKEQAEETDRIEYVDWFNDEWRAIQEAA